MASDDFDNFDINNTSTDEDLTDNTDTSSFEDDYSSIFDKDEKDKQKPTMDRFFDMETHLYHIEKSMRGYSKVNDTWIYTNKPHARSHFINYTMNALRSVITEINSISSMTEPQIEVVLLEKNKEFIFKALEEPTIEDDMLEPLVNMFDHSLEMFMGLVAGGHNADTLKQIYAGIARDKATATGDDSLLSVGFGDNKLLSIGGKTK